MGSWRRGRGGLIGSPAPGGSGRAPPSQGSRCRFSSPALPSRVPGQGMSCSRRSLPGARGQGGPGGVLPSSPPPHLLPAQVRAAATTAAAPDSRRPRAGAVQGVGPGEGLGGSLAENEPAGAIWRLCPARASAPGGHCQGAVFSTSTAPAGEPRPLAKAGSRNCSPPPPGEVGCGPVGKDSYPQTLACQGSLLGWGE
nr:cuticlin-2-like [Odocoileus virginianus texanus]